jgi:hypothetical protein
VLIQDPRDEFEPHALLCTNLTAELLGRSLVHKTMADGSDFQVVRQRLNFESQRYWSETAIRWTALALLGVFSLVTLLLTHQDTVKGADAVQRRIRYDKRYPTFSADALVLLRKKLWAQEEPCRRSLQHSDATKVCEPWRARPRNAVCYAAGMVKIQLQPA